jgi:hypothetical protein
MNEPFTTMSRRTFAEVNAIADAEVAAKAPKPTIEDVAQELRRFSGECTRVANSLEREIEYGYCIRQSAESKQARVDILRLHAEWAEGILRSFNLSPTP